MNDERADSEVEGLRKQNAALDAQVKQLVKTEQRLFKYQKALDQQLRRIHAVNQLALDSATAFEPRQILDIGLSTLMSILSLDQGVGCLMQPSGRLEVTSLSAIPGLEFESTERLGKIGERYHTDPSQIPFQPTIAPWGNLLTAVPHLRPYMELVKELYAPPPDYPKAASVYVFTPLLGPRSQVPLGMLLLRTFRTSKVSYHERLPDASDLSFLQLLRSHLECSLENAIFHERLSQSASELEHRVEERTEALSTLNAELEGNLEELRETQSQLFQAGKLAAIGTLVAGLSHELNNPLGIIMGYSQSLLTKVHPSDPSYTGLEAIARQSRRCTTLVKSLLDFSRDRPPQREPVRPGAVVSRVYDFTYRQARSEDIELVVSCGWLSSDGRLLPEKSPNIDLFASPVELESALLNLVGNAIDATPRGGKVTIHVRSSTREKRRGVEFVVEDTGSGIAEALQPFVFDPFFTTKPVGHGTGLGLALVQRIADAHEGSLSFTTELDRGTAMNLWIPEVEDEDVAPSEVDATKGLAG